MVELLLTDLQKMLHRQAWAGPWGFTLRRTSQSPTRDSKVRHQPSKQVGKSHFLNSEPSSLFCSTPKQEIKGFLSREINQPERKDPQQLTFRDVPIEASTSYKQ